MYHDNDRIEVTNPGHVFAAGSHRERMFNLMKGLEPMLFVTWDIHANEVLRRHNISGSPAAWLNFFTATGHNEERGVDPVAKVICYVKPDDGE
jgi:hypothetical protein